jgi:hypothetical protein
VLTDWRYRTIGLHDFTTNRTIAPAFGPTGDHRMDGIFVAAGSAIRQDASAFEASLLDIAPTVLHLLGVGAPSDMDGRVLAELLDQETVGAAVEPVFAGGCGGAEGSDEFPVGSRYNAEDDAAIKKRLVDLGYL